MGGWRPLLHLTFSVFFVREKSVQSHEKRCLWQPCCLALETQNLEEVINLCSWVLGSVAVISIF